MVRKSVESVSLGEEKACGGKDLPKSQVLSSEWKTERVREYESGDSEDDELLCVVGSESEEWRLYLTRLAVRTTEDRQTDGTQTDGIMFWSPQTLPEDGNKKF